MAACELGSLMDRLEEERHQSERCKARINELIAEILERQRMLESHHASALEIHRAMQQLLSADRDVGPTQADVEDYDDYVPDPRELEVSQEILAEEPMAGEPLDGPGAAEPALCTQPAADTQASQDRLLQPHKRSSLGRRYARSFLAKRSTQSSAHDSASFSYGMSKAELEKQILAVLDKMPDRVWECKSRKNVRPTGEAK